jgi:hypothetical protein
MKLGIVGEDWVQDGATTYTGAAGFPQADPRLAGLLLNHRVVNGIFDDLSEDRDYDGDGRDDWADPRTGEWDPEGNTDRFIAAMAAWRERGVIAFTIGLQGGNPFRLWPPPQGMSTESLDCGAFNPDGTLRPAFMARLRRILDRAEKLDMVPIVNYFYQGGNRRVREDALGAAVDHATRWLLDAGYDRLIIDLANECDVTQYWPALQLPNIHELIYRVKDGVALHNQQTGHERIFYVGASFTGGYSVAEKLAQLPEPFMRAVDLLMPHGNSRSTQEVREAIVALRGRIAEVARGPMPIVYNEDIVKEAGAVATDADAGGADAARVDAGGDLEHLEACLEAHVSWGNLIRSHQQVPCPKWVDGTAVQRQWFEATARLAGAPRAPRSVHLFKHRI